jgi:hypothetical protein
MPNEAYDSRASIERTTMPTVSKSLESVRKRTASLLAKMVPLDVWVERQRPSPAEIELYQQLRAQLEKIVDNPVAGIRDTSLLTRHMKVAPKK